MEKRAHQPKTESEQIRSTATEQLSKQRDHMGIAAVDTYCEYCGGELKDMTLTGNVGGKKIARRKLRRAKSQYWEPGEKVTSSIKFDTTREYTREEHKYINTL